MKLKKRRTSKILISYAKKLGWFYVSQKEVMLNTNTQKYPDIWLFHIQEKTFQ